MKACLLIVDDERNTREGLADTFEDDYEVFTASNADEAERILGDRNRHVDVVVTDLKMAGRSGLSVIDFALSLPSRPVCIMMTAYGDVETAVEAMRRGAYDFLQKPINVEKLSLVIARALSQRETERENKAMSERLNQTFNFSKLIGESAALKSAVEKAQRVAQAKTSVLLLGETGTGKELFAQLIHQSSPRAKKPFVAVHCAAIAPSLLESEVFGHEKGAFTGATERRVGKFEAANSGTLFLDEIGEIDLSTQVKLLRFLETHTIERLGSTSPIHLDVRLVCATNRDLQAMVRAGTFREDLYYRLSVVTLHLPSLRERREDVALLVEHYVSLFAKENALTRPQISQEAMDLICAYDWPGNIRELRNFCENIVVMHSGSGEITVLDLDERFEAGKTKLSKRHQETKLIRKALIEAHGNQSKAAKLLGVTRKTVGRKIRENAELAKTAKRKAKKQ
ncbi:MAG: sigma-54 dependent transcriptional regulator [Opitutales bacterium]|nr:sigma-54 dependent transcriptional regulator [Opitutales bacterium]